MKKAHARLKPIIRFRSMLLGVSAVALLISVPLLMVWKQVHITSSSMRIEKMADSLSTLTREIATLQLRCERLASQERIEHIAKTKLGLDHPSADRIVIVTVPARGAGERMVWPREVAAFFIRSWCGGGPG